MSSPWLFPVKTGVYDFNPSYYRTDSWKRRKLPLYLPYKPYEYKVDYDYTPGRRPNGAKYFRKRIVYRSVENPEYMATRRKQPYARYHEMSDEARRINRDYVMFPEFMAVQYNRTKKAEKLANLLGGLWKRYKDKKLNDVLDREVLRKSANVDVQVLEGRPRKIHRPVNKREMLINGIVHVWTNKGWRSID